MRERIIEFLKQQLSQGYKTVYIEPILNILGIENTKINRRVAEEILNDQCWEKRITKWNNRVIYQFNYVEKAEKEIPSSFTLNVRGIKIAEIAQYLFEQKQLRDYDASDPFRHILKWEELDGISKQPYYQIAKDITSKYNVSETIIDTK